MCGPLPIIVSAAAYTLWVATQGIYRRYIVIVFVINTGKYRNVYRADIAISMEDPTDERTDGNGRTERTETDGDGRTCTQCTV